GHPGLGGLQRRDRPGQRRTDVVEVVLGRVDLAVDCVLPGLVAVDGAVERLRTGGRREGHDESGADQGSEGRCTAGKATHVTLLPRVTRATREATPAGARTRSGRAYTRR